jgi:amino acid transporter
MVFASYLGELLGTPESIGKAFARGAVTLAYLLHLRGTLFSGRLQTLLTTLKVSVLAVVAMLALTAGPSSWERLSTSSPEGWPAWLWWRRAHREDAVISA